MAYDPEVSLYDHFMLALKRAEDRIDTLREVVNERDRLYDIRFNESEKRVTLALASVKETNVQQHAVKEETFGFSSNIISIISALIALGALFFAFHK
jgi:hypothetical protein